MQNLNLLAWLYWNPPREAFSIPWIDHPVVWYGILFVTGYIIGYFVFVSILTHFLCKTQNIDTTAAKKLAFPLADRLVWFVVAGTLIGARLGAVFFYDWEMFREHPEQILQIWKGGLASHGGVAGVALALYLYTLSIRKSYPQLTFLRVLDYVAIPSAIAACFIRLGNFMNQEIVGTPSTLPWAVVFGNAADGSLPIPRHPVQLYEAIAYLITFFILYRIWKTKGDQLKPGVIVGWLFVLIFSSRIILEFWKNHQDAIIDTSFLQMGQLLSIPFVLIGLYLIFRKEPPLQENS